jgi:hypothetical protein
MAQPSLVVSALFVGLVILLACAIVLAVPRARIATLLGVVVWLGVTALLAARGALARLDSFPPPLIRMVVGALAAALALALSPWGRAVAERFSVGTLVGISAFRLLVEAILWELAREGSVPLRMTLDGRNFDVLTGLLALALFLWSRKRALPVAVVVGWNLLGFALLANVLEIAVRSAPGPQRAYFDGPPLTLPTAFPFVWLPGFVVPSALLAQSLSLRALSRRPTPPLPR